MLSNAFTPSFSLYAQLSSVMYPLHSLFGAEHTGQNMA